MDPTRESTYTFLDGLIGEMAALFPDAYFHIGGDECPGTEWDRNPAIQQFKRAHGLKDNAALQAYFTGRVQKLVAKHGKIAEGWDEVLQPDTPHDVLIQSWRGQESLAEAASRGYRSILSAGYYIDLNQSAAQHYAVDPLVNKAHLTPEQEASILGGEATMWSEFVTPQNVNMRIWPRTAAIAERLWSPATVRDVDSMYARLAIVAERLKYEGIDNDALQLTMLQRMSGELDPAPLRVLASIVEPPKEYAREGLRAYDHSTPLNRLVDAVPSESDTARHFRQIVDQIAAGKATPEQAQQARQWLTLWRDNDAKLQPLLAHSELTADLAPLSQSLHQVAAIGLEALDHLEQHTPIAAGLAEQQLATLKEAAKPQAVVLDMTVPSVEKLVRAAAHE